MPRPPVLPTIDWKSVFESGVEYDTWLDRAEMPDHRNKMQEIFFALTVDPVREAAVANLPRTVHIVAIAEDWCGDVVRFTPVLMKLASLSGGKVCVRFITRQQHPDVFIRFLTNGGEAIPKFVFLNDGFVECGNWGPMPSDCRRLIARGKGAGNVAAARDRVRQVYASDPNNEIAIKEFMELLDTAVCTVP